VPQQVARHLNSRDGVLRHALGRIEHHRVNAALVESVAVGAGDHIGALLERFIDQQLGSVEACGAPP
jgi:hypothetical protein